MTTNGAFRSVILFRIPMAITAMTFPVPVDNFALETPVSKPYCGFVNEMPAKDWHPRRAGHRRLPARRIQPRAWDEPPGKARLMHVLSLERRAAVVSHLTDCGSVRATS